MGQHPPTVSKDPTAAATQIRRTGKVEPLATPVKRLSGPVQPFSPESGGEGVKTAKAKPPAPVPVEKTATRRLGSVAMPAPPMMPVRPTMAKPVKVRPWRPAPVPVAEDRGEATTAAAPEAVAPGLKERIRRSMAEIVVDVNTAFFIFAVMAALICVAFVLGYRRGQEEAARVRADAGAPEEDRARMRSAAPPRMDEYVLLLSVYDEDENVRDHRSAEDVERLAGEVLRDLRVRFGDTYDVAVFHDPERRTRSLAATGGFRSENDPGLETLALFFRSYEGPRQEPERFPYAGNRKLRVDHPSLGSFESP